MIVSEIMTYTGKMFDPLRPEWEKIDIADIAHALSMLCRANGHFPTFYSVAQHCINCMVYCIEKYFYITEHSFSLSLWRGFFIYKFFFYFNTGLF